MFKKSLVKRINVLVQIWNIYTLITKKIYVQLPQNLRRTEYFINSTEFFCYQKAIGEKDGLEQYFKNLNN